MNTTDSEEKNKVSVSPSHGWSPHTAALHRRRKFDANTDRSKLQTSLGTLNLNDSDEEDFLNIPVKPKSDSKIKTRSGSFRSKSPGKNQGVSRSSRSKSPGALSKSQSSSITGSPSKPKGGKEIVNQKDIAFEILQKLAIITDPDVPLKERVQVEVDMMKDPYEKKVLVEFRHTFDRKSFLSMKADWERQEQKRIAKNIKTEEEIEKEFKQGLARKRQQAIEEEIAKADREAKMLADARQHAVKSIAQGMEQVRKDAEKTVQVASESRLRKKKEQEALEAELEHFRRTEGKYMHDAQRALKEARIEQKYIDREV